MQLSATSDEGTPQPTKRHQCILSLVDVQSDDGKDDDTDDETIIYETGVPNLEIDTLEVRPKAKAKWESASVEEMGAQDEGTQSKEGQGWGTEGGLEVTTGLRAYRMCR